MPISEVYNEDCFDVLKRMPNGSVDLFLQDTPFGVTQNDWDVKPDLHKLWPEWLRTGKNNTAFIFFATQPFASELIYSKPDLFRYDLIWRKSNATGFLNAQKQPLRTHEHILVFYRSQPSYSPLILDKPKKNIRPIEIKPRPSSNYGKFKEGNTRTIPIDKSYPDSVLYFDIEKKTDAQHPTQKPLELIRYLIQTYSLPEQFVFDGYLGSGTTRIASFIDHRNFIGSENNEGYFILQNKRFAEQTAQLQLFKTF